MQKSIFELKRMDCPAEENLVRLRLGDVSAVKSLVFDLAGRKLTVFHNGELTTIHDALHELQLDDRLIDTTTATELPRPESDRQRSTLWLVLLINFTFFTLEASFGLLSGSMGLVADSLDMLADALVYGLSLFAVGAAIARKKSLATLSGYLQLTLALVGLLELLRRFLGVERLPDFQTMITVSAFALLANAASLYLLQRANSQEVHMQASMIFTSNDVVINLGVIAAGVLVYALDSSLPDLIIGGIVFVIVTRGAIRILRLGTG